MARPMLGLQTLPGGGHQRLPGCHRQELAFADELAPGGSVAVGCGR
jgi:hypothetical protein